MRTLFFVLIVFFGVVVVFLWQVNLVEEYDILQTVGEGWFAKVLLTEHRRTRAEVVLKAVSKDATSRREFFREFHYSYYRQFLSFCFLFFQLRKEKKEKKTVSPKVPSESVHPVRNRAPGKKKQ